MQIKSARDFAAKAHRSQWRKLTAEPYFVHVEGVARLLQGAGFCDEVIMAGYLHDTVEDTNVTSEEIKKLFGAKVASLVVANTEDKSKSWEERKEDTINSVASLTMEQKALLAADKLDNMRSISLAQQRYGDDVWGFFKRGRNKQKWYYENVVKQIFLHNNMEKNLPLFQELKSEVDKVFSL